MEKFKQTTGMSEQRKLTTEGPMRIKIEDLQEMARRIRSDKYISRVQYTEHDQAANDVVSLANGYFAGRDELELSAEDAKSYRSLLGVLDFVSPDSGALAVPAAQALEHVAHTEPARVPAEQAPVDEAQPRVDITATAIEKATDPSESVSVILPEFARSPEGVDLMQELKDEIRKKGSVWGNSALMYLGVIGAYPPAKENQKMRSAVFDAVSEFSRQLLRHWKDMGYTEEQKADKLRQWARVLSRTPPASDPTMTISVPVLGSGLDMTWMVYGYGNEVTEIVSWCVRTNAGIVAKKAEVNYR